MSDPHRTTDAGSDHDATRDFIAGETSTQDGTGTSPLPGAVTDERTSLPTIPGYQVTGVIARGGMGLVLAARDPVLNREVAIKVLIPGTARRELARRFVTESRITARLPHPGIPPVHQLGELPDGNPFLAMKLIRGRTLAEDLKNTRVVNDLPRLIHVFEQIAQAVAFAHSVGVIHRDLKPANVMVGAFGEVQVMDWGLAKEFRAASHESRRASSDREFPSAADPEVGLVSSERTQAGTVLGTPAYMAPEQARGETVDARADVFALGGILLAILTGRPPFTGKSTLEVLKKAASGELREAIALLNASRADPELLSLARLCLSPDPEDRPHDAGGVARLVEQYRSGVEERLRRSESERAAALARAEEQKRKRRWQLLAGTAGFLLLIAGGGFAWWQAKEVGERKAQQARFDGEREANANQARKRVGELLALSVELRRQYRFAEASNALNQAKETGHMVPDLTDSIQTVAEDLAFVRELDEIRMRRFTWVSRGHDRGYFQVALGPPAYRKAFASRGLDVLDNSDATGHRISTLAIREEVISALDDWALSEKEPKVRDKVLAAAQRADPSPEAARFRDPRVWNNKALLREYTLKANPARMSPGTIVLVAELMERHGDGAVGFLQEAMVVYPREFSLAFSLGTLFHENPGHELEQIAAYRTARALRPDHYATLINLGYAESQLGELHTAAATFREAIRLYPHYAGGYGNLGLVLTDLGDWAGAAEAYRKEAELAPDEAAPHYNLGICLRHLGDNAAAAAALQRAITLESNNLDALASLAGVLLDAGDPDGALTVCEKAVKFDPRYAPAYINLGNALLQKGDISGAERAFKKVIELTPNDVKAQTDLGATLLRKGDVDQALSVLQNAIKIDPKHAPAHCHLGMALAAKGDHQAALAAFNESVRLDPRYANGRYSLGVALFNVGDINGAAAAWSETLRLDPKHAKAMNNLAAVHLERKQFKEAIATAQNALKLDPKNAQTHALLGEALRLSGDLTGARIAYTEAARLDPKRWQAYLQKLDTPSKP